MEYVTKTYKNCKKIIQLEHIDAVENLAEIVKVEGIDGFIIGPNDLSGSLGELGNVFGEKTMEQIRRALKIVKENGKYVGLATGDLRPETLRFWSELGIDMMTVGADWNFVFDAAKNTRKLLEQYHMEA
jgi:2-dehydro-3-deoxyglucarate aldolase/4-hydroxy-2-oxoheptanedioate aldolase